MIWNNMLKVKLVNQLKLPLEIDYLIPVCEELLSKLINILADKNEISKETLFVDGTKIESSANRYTFVWRKSVTKDMQKMIDKIPDFILKCEQDFGIKLIYKNKTWNLEG
ncbi:hypothetical protein [Terrisporobacter vanillatitrophus]|uniref:hypothetical protein n=1 Tax=Terrisporobacter vanillatitrophus TaxID=3058402 RepID=UPI003EBF2920